MALYLDNTNIQQSFEANFNDGNDTTRLIKIYYNGVLVWSHKNTSVITWDDALTGDHAASYSGDRLSSDCSCYDSSANQGSGRVWVAAGAHGRINPGTKHITVSAWVNGDYSIITHNEIYNCDGVIVGRLSGTTDVSAYNDGTYYFAYSINGYSEAEAAYPTAGANVRLSSS